MLLFYSTIEVIIVLFQAYKNQNLGMTKCNLTGVLDDNFGEILTIAGYKFRHGIAITLALDLLQ